eukprot:c19704_g1_i3.p1 GENE.c19704_g1_i3~~c19704_g1_i3.p1  ORF type:complete len:341 (-),score=79.72 c19704_g1_i3:52-1029(-)
MQQIKVSEKGEFIRVDSAFRNWIKADGSTEFKPESGRYHLYVSYACPFASRCLLVRALKGLEETISLSVTSSIFRKTVEDPADTHHGWWFTPVEGEKDCIPDTNLGCETIRQLYEKCGDTLGKYSVPILFDKKTSRIVNNESSEIVRMFEKEFNEFAKYPELDLYPSHLTAEIDNVNSWVYEHINNGVYKCGFARSQEAYDTAVTALFDHLDKAEEILSKQRYIASPSVFTEADVRLFGTLVRFDPAYVTHFKCNKKRIADYPNLAGYVRDIYQMPQTANTVNMKHIKEHYYMSHKMINPYAIVPIGFDFDLNAPHNRDKLSYSS